MTHSNWSLHLDAEGSERGLVLIAALRGEQQGLVAGHAEDDIGVVRLVLLLRLPDEQVVAERVERHRQRLALLVDEFIGAVGLPLDDEHLLALVAVVAEMLVDGVAPALAERRRRVGERKLRLLGDEAAGEQQRDWNEEAMDG